MLVKCGVLGDVGLVFALFGFTTAYISALAFCWFMAGRLGLLTMCEVKSFKFSLGLLLCDTGAVLAY